MKQKIIKIGNAAGIIIPKNIREEAGLKLGDSVAVQYSTQNEMVQIGKKATKNTSPITPEFYAWFKRFNTRYKKALSELAKK